MGAAGVVAMSGEVLLQALGAHGNRLGRGVGVGDGDGCGDLRAKGMNEPTLEPKACERNMSREAGGPSELGIGVA